MKNRKELRRQADDGKQRGAGAERGTATIIAVMIMGLLALFVAASLSRVTSEALTMGNDYANTQAFYAAQASIELMSRNFGEVFNTKTILTPADVTAIQNAEPMIANFVFDQTLVQVGGTVTQPIPEGPYAGLVSLRDDWAVTTTSTHNMGAQVALSRTFFNHLIPIYQFAAFYDKDMEFSPGGKMDVAGRVHTNSDLYMAADDRTAVNPRGLTFLGRVTAAGQIVRHKQRNGLDPLYGGDPKVTRGPATTPADVSEGSVTNGPDLLNADDRPNGTVNSGWGSFQTRFNGNLVARAPRLLLPLQVSGEDPIQIIKRGLATDSVVIAAGRFYNKSGIRVTLTDSQARLPGGTGGIRLDGNASGDGTYTAGGVRGYVPTPMTGPAYQAQPINGHRFYTLADYPGGQGTRQTWIKIELVIYNVTDPDTPTTEDRTADFLSLGMTDVSTFTRDSDNTLQPYGDDRAIFKIQRYQVPGAPLKVNDVHSTINTADFTVGDDPRALATDPNTRVYTHTGVGAAAFNCVTNANLYVDANEDARKHATPVNIGGVTFSVIPFPIQMFDVREGLFNEDLTNAQYNTIYSVGGKNARVAHTGVMSLLDIDVANLKRFLDGTGGYDTNFPFGLRRSMVPRDSPQNGVVLYVSDRRGDYDNDGVYDMENIYIDKGPLGEVPLLQTGEDISGANAAGSYNLTSDGLIQADNVWESDEYDQHRETDMAATRDHKYFRRAVRLINGRLLPGTATAGFTFATENGCYVKGSYNATNITGATFPTPVSGYQNSLGTMVPASIVADAITILSNTWMDGNSFRNPHAANAAGDANLWSRWVQPAGETTVRAAMLMGTSKSGPITTPNQGGLTQNLNGGVHNFPRYLEIWGSPTQVRLNYCGSMIGLFYARGSNGSFKFGNWHTYNAPNRNWTFDTNFQVPSQLPPATPYLQYIQVTGFRQIFRQTT